MTIWNRVKMSPPHDCGKWVKIDVHLLRVSDGVERVYHTDGILEDDDETLSTFIWRDGNFACDCNRQLFFERAGGESIEYEDGEPECSDGQYIVWIVNPADGSVVYDERK